MTQLDDVAVKTAVQRRYRSLALAAGAETLPMAGDEQTCCGPKNPVTSSGVPRRERARQLYGESAMDLPDTVLNAVAGCGNTIELGWPRPGEVVVDLGSGGGIDVFLAGRAVGPGGRVIGIDMTPEMIALARQNARQVQAENVEFRLGELEHVPVGDASADLVISNCVINLAPDKEAVFKEALRVLRPGGRLAVSDVTLTGELPDEERRNPELWAGCVAGALREADYLRAIRRAGFSSVEVAARSPSARPGVASIKVRATKPAA